MFLFTIVSLALLCFQIIYLSLFLLSFLKREEGSSGSKEPVSIIVSAHDEEHNLRELVPLLLAQNYTEYEVIVVEDRCNDATYDYLMATASLDNRLKMVRVVHKPEHITGKKFALTLGLKAARYDWILLTDADCRPASNNWISSMNEQMGDGTQIVLGFSPYVKSEGFINSFIRFESFLTGIQYMGLAILGMPFMGVGRNLAYRKSLFLENKGFNSHLGIVGGDDDLFINQHAARSNTRVCMGKESLMMSVPKTTWKEYYVQKIRHLSVGKYYKFSDKLILGIFSLTWIFTSLVALPFCFFSPFMEWILLAFLLRWALLVFVFHQASLRFGEPFEAWKAPFLDFIYAFYYLVTGSMALVSKKVRWKS